MTDLIEKGKEKGDTAKPYRGVLWVFLSIIAFLIIAFIMLVLFSLADTLWFSLQA